MGGWLEAELPSVSGFFGAGRLEVWSFLSLSLLYVFPNRGEMPNETWRVFVCEPLTRNDPKGN